MRYAFENRFFGYLNNMERRWRALPLNLGGTPTGSGGGGGGPPGGFVGYLPQYRIAFDESELESLIIPATGIAAPSGRSLVTNLNRIRYRLAQLEAGSGSEGGTTVIVEEDDIIIASGVTILNFEGDVAVVNNGGGKVTVTISGGDGGSLSVEEDNVLTASNVTILNIGNSMDTTDDGAGQVTVKLPASITITSSRLKANNIFSIGAGTLHTISGGAITLTDSNILLQGESDTTDTLTTINGGEDGDIIIIHHNGGEYTITIDGDGDGNIYLNGGIDFELPGSGTILLFYNGSISTWIDLGKFSV
jgi:hypothetical protein